MSVSKAKARLSALHRHRGPEDPAVADAARDLEAEKLEAHMERVAASLPPLTPEQKERLRALLA